MALELALHHLPRIRQLIILDADMYKLDLALRTSPAPLLETLMLDGDTWVLPSDIFKSQAPRLRSLTLRASMGFASIILDVDIPGTSLPRSLSPFYGLDGPPKPLKS